jgi:Sensors of blue-light using FAD
MSREDLLALLGQCRPKNQRLGVTGLLVHKAGHFLQILEGERSVVEPLMATIGADPRHTEVSVLVRDEGAPRRFGQWAMALADWPGEDVATTASWAALLDEFSRSKGRFGPGAGLVEFALSLAKAGYLE